LTTWEKGGGTVIEIEDNAFYLTGPQGSILVKEDDEITLKLCMIIEGECEGLGAALAADKFGFTRQRYYQILQQFRTEGAEALKSKKRGPKGNYRRTDEAVRQVIRHRFLDPEADPEVIAQMLTQSGMKIRTRSVERVISDFGLQKKSFTRADQRARR
jgi:transposase